MAPSLRHEDRDAVRSLVVDAEGASNTNTSRATPTIARAAHTGTYRARLLVLHALQQDTVGAELRGFLLHSCDRLVHILLTSDREGTLTGGVEGGDLLVLCRRLDVDPHALGRDRWARSPYHHVRGSRASEQQRGKHDRRCRAKYAENRRHGSTSMGHPAHGTAQGGARLL